MEKNKTPFKAVATVLIFLFAVLLIARKNVSAQDLNSYFSGDKNAISISEFVENIQISKADISDIIPEIGTPEVDIVDEGGLGGDVVSDIASNVSDSNEFIQFWDDLQEDVWQDICKAARLSLSEKAEIADIAGIKGKFKRYLKQYPDKRIALVDEVGIDLTGDYGSELFNIADNPFNVSFNAKMEGKSIVVRRLDGIKYCDEILTVLDLRNVKTILPVRSKRILKMKPGEIWKFPMTIKIGISGSINTVQHGISVGLSFGTAREKKPSVSLYKMDAKTLRLRVRFDKATIKSIGVSAKAFTLSAGDIGLFEAENVLTKLVHRGIAKEFNKYLSFKLGLSHSRVKGKKILMEFLIDAQDPRQIDRLVDFLKGDLNAIKKLWQINSQFEDVDIESDLETGVNSLNNVENVAEDIIGSESNFVGSDHFNSQGNSFNIQVPFLHMYEKESNLRYDRYQKMDGEKILHVHQVSDNMSNSSINIPWIGKRHKRKIRRSAYVVNYEKAGGAVSEPVVMYQRYDGIVRRSESTVKNMVEEVNDIMKYAGMKGDGVNYGNTINTDEMFPKLAGANNNPQYDKYGNRMFPDRRRYKSAVLSFAMAFTKTAVRDIINAPATLVMKAFFNILEGFDKQVIDKVSNMFNVSENGKIKYNYRAVEKVLKKEFWWIDFDNNDNSEESPMDVVRYACYKVSRIVADLSSIRSVSDRKEQSKRMTKVLGGKSKSRIGYGKMLKVLVQFVDPENLYANVNFQTRKGISGEEDIDEKREFFNENVGSDYDSQFSEATALRDRFNSPSTLTD